MRPCITKDCDGELGDHSKHDECTNCRSYYGRWAKRTAAEVRERHRKLQVWDCRLASVMPKSGGRHLSSVPIRKRA